jgi:DNA-binding transcriptional LysR family regulator
MRNVTVRQLQIFVAASQAQSFARAAERLRLSPAAVSFQIRQIEDLSGVALFERIGRKVVPTEAGTALLGYARIVLQALADGDQALTALRGGVGGRITIGAISTAKYLVPHVLARFQAAYPAVAIHLRDGNRREIADALAGGAIDLAVMGRPAETADVQATPFAAHPSVVIAPAGHPLADRTELPPAALAGERFIAREDGSGTRALLDQLCRDAGFAPHIAMTTSSNETIKQAVMAGMGIALISRHTIGLELALGLLRTLPVDGFPLLPVHVRLRAFLLEQGQEVIDALERRYAAAAGG